MALANLANLDSPPSYVHDNGANVCVLGDVEATGALSLFDLLGAGVGAEDPPLEGTAIFWEREPYDSRVRRVRVVKAVEFGADI